MPAAVPATPSMMPAAPGTPLDRIVAIVNDDVILDSDVNQELRFEAFDPYRNPLEGTSRDKVIERLINRALILQQLKLQPEDGPSDADMNKEIDELRKNIPACAPYHCQTKEGWNRFLTDHGFNEASFSALWKERMTVLNFIEERFQTGIDITQAQIKDYYDKVLLPEYARQHAPAPKIDAISNQIHEILVQEQISNLLQDWLQSLRAQGSVVVLHPGEEAP
jgi:parvulin-like peptidyl-prolyl isomerase